MLYTMPGGAALVAPNFVYNAPPPPMQQMPMQTPPPPYAALAQPVRMVPEMPVAHGSMRHGAQMRGHEASVGQQMVYMPPMECLVAPGMQPARYESMRPMECPTPQYPAQHPMHYQQQQQQQHFGYQPAPYHMPAPHHLLSHYGHGRPIGRPLLPHLAGHATKSRKKRAEAPRAGQKATAPARQASRPNGTAPKPEEVASNRCIDVADELTRMPLGSGGQKRVVPEASEEAPPAPSATVAGDGAKRAKRPAEDVDQPVEAVAEASDGVVGGGGGGDETPAGGAGGDESQ